MLTLKYDSGICTEVIKEDNVTLLHSLLPIAERVVICTQTSVFCVHLNETTVLYFSGFTERMITSLYTSVLAPYSEIGESDDNDLYVSTAQIVCDRFAERLQKYVKL